MDLTGQLHDNLDVVFQFLNSHRPAITPEFIRLREMETETATNTSGVDSQYCKCRNRDIPGSCTCGRPRDPLETENDISPSEPSPKIHRLTPFDDTLDVQTPFDPEFQESKIAQDIHMKPLSYESVSVQPRPDEPLGAGECNFDRPEPVPRGQVAVEFLPWLPIDSGKKPVPPIFRWAVIMRRNAADPPLKNAAQRRLVFQAAIKKVPYSRATRGREYQERGTYEWQLCLG